MTGESCQLILTRKHLIVTEASSARIVRHFLENFSRASAYYTQTGHARIIATCESLDRLTVFGDRGVLWILKAPGIHSWTCVGKTSILRSFSNFGNIERVSIDLLTSHKRKRLASRAAIPTSILQKEFKVMKVLFDVFFFRPFGKGSQPWKTASTRRFWLIWTIYLALLYGAVLISH